VGRGIHGSALSRQASLSSLSLLACPLPTLCSSPPSIIYPQRSMNFKNSWSIGPQKPT